MKPLRTYTGPMLSRAGIFPPWSNRETPGQVRSRQHVNAITSAGDPDALPQME